MLLGANAWDTPLRTSFQWASPLLDVTRFGQGGSAVPCAAKQDLPDYTHVCVRLCTNGQAAQADSCTLWRCSRCCQSSESGPRKGSHAAALLDESRLVIAAMSCVTPLRGTVHFCALLNESIVLEANEDMGNACT